MDTLVVALIVGIFGGASSAVLGWLGSEEEFVPRKFVYGVIRAMIAGFGLAVLFPITQGTKDIALLFLATVGVDTGTDKITRIVTDKKKADKKLAEVIR